MNVFETIDLADAPTQKLYDVVGHGDTIALVSSYLEYD
jgi:hypothetical protein